jgi:hypothetical protein
VRRFTCLYDFGDHWSHIVEVKCDLALLPGEEVPILLAGKRHSPPRDVSSLSGFEEFLEAWPPRTSRARGYNHLVWRAVESGRHR